MLKWYAIAVMALVTYLIRLAPFVLFRKDKTTPRWVAYIGSVLPPAVMGMLIVYSLKSIHIGVVNEVMPVIFAVGITAVLHLWKRNNLISILSGTAIYMILIQM
ncbi:branched-chain amino acid transporter permease [Fusibacter bizertensis]